VIDLFMYRVLNIKSVGIGDTRAGSNGRGIEVPGIGHRKGIHYHMHGVHIVKVEITAESGIVAVDVAAVDGVEKSLYVLVPMLS
jgi:hypothetical protein